MELIDLRCRRTEGRRSCGALRGSASAVAHGDTIDGGVLAALDQRIAVRYTITGMSAPDTADYIRHHCKIVGRSDTLFSDDAIGLIHNAFRGHPRAVNNPPYTLLTAAFAADHAIVDEKAARIAICETAAD